MTCTDPKEHPCLCFLLLLEEVSVKDHAHWGAPFLENQDFGTLLASPP